MKNTINEALKPVADMLGCMTYIESTSRLTVVGEEMADSPQNLHDDAE